MDIVVVTNCYHWRMLHRDCTRCSKPWERRCWCTQGSSPWNLQWRNSSSYKTGMCRPSEHNWSCRDLGSPWRCHSTTYGSDSASGYALLVCASSLLSCLESGVRYVLRRLVSEQNLCCPVAGLGSMTLRSANVQIVCYSFAGHGCVYLCWVSVPVSHGWVVAPGSMRHYFVSALNSHYLFVDSDSMPLCLVAARTWDGSIVGPGSASLLAASVL